MTLAKSSTSPVFTRRRLLTGGVLGAAALALYAGEGERHWIDLTRIDITVPGLPEAFDGFCIAQLSDIHLIAWTEPSFLRRAISHINALKPDAVCLTGDFVSEAPDSPQFPINAAWQCAQILTGIECRQIYGILGNHDVIVGSDEVTKAMRTHGVTMLRNEYVAIERGGSRFWLAGVDDPLKGTPDPAAAIPERIRNVPKEPVILMCHAPDYVDDLITQPAGKAVSLVLSGHTHGGQVRVPFVGPLTLPELGRKYVEGYFRLGNTQLYVNRGIGTVGVPFRFDCPPEITLLTLRRG